MTPSCGKITPHTMGRPCGIRAGHGGECAQPKPVYGQRQRVGYIVEQYSAGSYTVEWNEYSAAGEWTANLLGSYSTKRQALAGMRWMKVLGIRR